MYYRNPVPVPDVPGKIVRKHEGDSVYVLLETARVYDRKRGYTIPKRTIIGKLLPNTDGMDDRNGELMLANKKFAELFPNVDLGPLDVPSNREKPAKSSTDGRSVFERFCGATTGRLTDQLSDIAPDAQAWIHDFVFGTVYARRGLSDEAKAIATITTLAALGGCERELRTHIQTALNVGVAPERIVSTFLHMAPYAGFPRVLNALFVAKEVFELRGVSVNVPKKKA